MKLTLNVSFEDAIEMVSYLADRARHKEDENFNRLPKEERLKKLDEIRAYIPQLMTQSGEWTTDKLSKITQCSENIDYYVKCVNNEEK